MQVGTIAYDCWSGLGLLAKSFVDHGLVNRVMVHRHPIYPSHPDWYPQAYHSGDMHDFLDNLDVLFLFETGLNFEVVRVARSMGKKIVVMPMYEYTPMPFPVQVDLFICPSLLDLEVYKEHKSIFITVPVNRKWKLRQTAQVWVHNAGHGGTNYRNGTPELLEAMQYVNKDVKLIVRGQPEERQIQKLFAEYKGDPRVELVLANVPDEELYSVGDVFIFPEKFNGLSLPLQEAYASGMLVMATNRFPMNIWLPTPPLIPVAGYETFRLATTFQRAKISPRTIATHIDRWYGQNIEQYSLKGAVWAAEHSWDKLLPKYRAALEQLL